MRWTPKTIEALWASVRAGDTYAETAAKLNCERSAVAGKLFRLRLEAEGNKRSEPQRVHKRMTMYRFRRHKINPEALPVIQELFKAMNEQQCPLTLMANKSGVSRNTLLSWQYRGNPNHAMLEACFGVLGKRFVIVDIAED